MPAFPPTPEQHEAITLFLSGGNVSISALAGTGKALRDDQRILTVDGWKPIGDARVGDRVFGSDGKSHRVTAVFPQGVRELYSVVFSDGSEVIADGDHLWTVENTFDRSSKPGFTGRVMSTRDLIAHGVRSPKGRAKWFLPAHAPIEHETQLLPIDPWLLGVILGDGCIKQSLTLSLPDLEMRERVERLISGDGLVLCPRPRFGAECIDFAVTSHRVRSGRKGIWNPLLDYLNELGLRRRGQTHATRSDRKFIPQQYLRGSAMQRLELLRGLLDTDGTRCNANSFEFYSMSRHLADGVCDLVRSLGGVGRVRTKRGAVDRHGHRYGISYRVYATFPTDMCPFWLPRKAADWGVGARLEPVRTLDTISAVSSAKATCITVDAPDALYLTEGYVLTHNTSLLQFMAEAVPGRRGLYAAFNKALATEGAQKFAGTSVTSRTMHALAYRSFGAGMQHRLSDREPVRWQEKAHVCGIGEKYLLPADSGARTAALSRQQLVRATEATVKRFLNSDSPIIEPALVVLPMNIGELKEKEEARLRDTVTGFANKYWQDLQRPDGVLKFTHDCYLKMFELSRPQLPFDYILFDEAQDASPVITSILHQQQNTQVIAVGDKNQAIYSWRGAIDSMDSFGGAATSLTTSFRFGQPIADAANDWLELLGADLRVSGLPGKPASVWASERTPEAVLTRTNAGALSELVHSQTAGIPTGIAGERKAKELRSLAAAAKNLQDKGWTAHPELSPFHTWMEVADFADSEDGEDLKPFVDIVDKFGAGQVVSIIDSCVPTDRARTVVSTAHVAKGLEWLHVRISDDFRDPGDRGGSPKALPAEEARLAYVSVTRPTRHLDPSGFDWLDGYLARGGFVEGSFPGAVAETAHVGRTAGESAAKQPVSEES